jgi:hypothetical protein
MGHEHAVTDQLLIDFVRLLSPQGQIWERPAKCDDVNEHTNIPNFQKLCNISLSLSLSVLHS